MSAEGIDVEVYDRRNINTFLGVIPDRLNPTWLEELREGYGGGSFDLPMDNPLAVNGASLLNYGNLMKIVVDGVVRGAFTVQKKDNVLIGENEATDRVYRISGQGLLSEPAQYGLVYGAGGSTGQLVTKTPSERTFNFGSFRGVWYKASEWKTPVKMYTAKDTTTANPWKALGDWPDGVADGATWIWSQAATVSAPAGMNYFRREMTGLAKGKYAFMLTADQSWVAYVDGVEVGSNTDIYAYAATSSLDVDLEAGDHVLAVKVRSNGGPAGLIAAFAQYGDVHVPNSAVLITDTSDSGWKVNGYPTQPPGFTAGELFLTLWNECKARGIDWFNWLTPDFTADVDSAGIAWADQLEWTLAVGSAFSTVIDSIEQTVGSFYVDPVTLTVRCFQNRGTHLDVEGAASTVVLDPAYTIMSATEDGTTEGLANTLIVATEEGWSIQQSADAAFAAAFGRRERAVGSSDFPTTFLNSYTKRVFETTLKVLEGATIEVTGLDFVPWKNFGVGDWILAPGADTDRESRRVMSIAVTEDNDTGRALYTLEVDTISQDRTDALERWAKTRGAYSSIPLLTGAPAKGVKDPGDPPGPPGKKKTTQQTPTPNGPIPKPPTVTGSVTWPDGRGFLTRTADAAIPDFEDPGDRFANAALTVENKDGNLVLSWRNVLDLSRYRPAAYVDLTTDQGSITLSQLFTTGMTAVEIQADAELRPTKQLYGSSYQEFSNDLHGAKQPYYYAAYFRLKPKENTYFYFDTQGSNYISFASVGYYSAVGTPPPAGWQGAVNNRGSSDDTNYPLVSYDLHGRRLDTPSASYNDTLVANRWQSRTVFLSAGYEYFVVVGFTQSHAQGPSPVDMSNLSLVFNWHGAAVQSVATDGGYCKALTGASGSELLNKNYNVPVYLTSIFGLSHNPAYGTGSSVQKYPVNWLNFFSYHATQDTVIVVSSTGSTGPVAVFTGPGNSNKRSIYSFNPVKHMGSSVSTSDGAGGSTSSVQDFSFSSTVSAGTDLWIVAEPDFNAIGSDEVNSVDPLLTGLKFNWAAYGPGDTIPSQTYSRYTLTKRSGSMAVNAQPGDASEVNAAYNHYASYFDFVATVDTSADFSISAWNGYGALPRMTFGYYTGSNPQTRTFTTVSTSTTGAMAGVPVVSGRSYTLIITGASATYNLNPTLTIAWAKLLPLTYYTINTTQSASTVQLDTPESGTAPELTVEHYNPIYVKISPIYDSIAFMLNARNSNYNTRIRIGHYTSSWTNNDDNNRVPTTWVTDADSASTPGLIQAVSLNGQKTYWAIITSTAVPATALTPKIDWTSLKQAVSPASLDLPNWSAGTQWQVSQNGVDAIAEYTAQDGWIYHAQYIKFTPAANCTASFAGDANLYASPNPTGHAIRLGYYDVNSERVGPSAWHLVAESKTEANASPPAISNVALTAGRTYYLIVTSKLSTSQQDLYLNWKGLKVTAPYVLGPEQPNRLTTVSGSKSLGTVPPSAANELYIGNLKTGATGAPAVSSSLQGKNYHAAYTVFTPQTATTTFMFSSTGTSYDSWIAVVRADTGAIVAYDDDSAGNSNGLVQNVSLAANVTYYGIVFSYERLPSFDQASVTWSGLTNPKTS